MLYILVGENESMGKFICNARSAYVAGVIGRVEEMLQVIFWIYCYYF